MISSFWYLLTFGILENQPCKSVDVHHLFCELEYVTGSWCVMPFDILGQCDLPTMTILIFATHQHKVKLRSSPCQSFALFLLFHAQMSEFSWELSVRRSQSCWHCKSVTVWDIHHWLVSVGFPNGSLFFGTLKALLKVHLSAVPWYLHNCQHHSSLALKHNVQEVSYCINLS